MSRTRTLLAVLALALVASACASAVASAELPELRSSSFPIKYTSEFSGTTWEVVGGSNFRCLGTNGSAEGEITGVKTVTAVMRFHGCKAGESFCTSEGAAQGEIVTQPLEGTAVYPPNFGNAFAIVFKAKSGVNVVSKFKCIVNAEIRGAVLAVSNTPRNKPTSTIGLSFTETGGYQTPEWYYNEAVEKIYPLLETTWLGGGSFQRIGLNIGTIYLHLSGGTVEPVFA